MQNTVILKGNIGKMTPGETKNGKQYLKLSVAEKTGKDTSQWHYVTCWNKTAEYVGKYAQVGSMVLIQGTLKIDTYEKDGQKRNSYDVWANNVDILTKFNSNATSGDAAGAGQPEPGFSSQDIPF